MAAGAGNAGDARAGKLKVEEARCLECHGNGGTDPANASGQGYIATGADGKFAKLAGQYSGYIVKQFRDFRSGRRTHDFMSMMANSVNDDDLADIAAFFGGRQTPQSRLAADVQATPEGMQAPAGLEAPKTFPAVGNPSGKALFLAGDAARNIVACIACHGASGNGNGAANIPAIGGQRRFYLKKQLLDWRSGERHNDIGGAMNGIAKGLTDAEITALADYVSGL